MDGWFVEPACYTWLLPSLIHSDHARLNVVIVETEDRAATTTVECNVHRHEWIVELLASSTKVLMV
jgi:hypothetical protein